MITKLKKALLEIKKISNDQAKKEFLAAEYQKLEESLNELEEDITNFENRIKIVFNRTNETEKLNGLIAYTNTFLVSCKVSLEDVYQDFIRMAKKMKLEEEQQSRNNINQS